MHSIDVPLHLVGRRTPTASVAHASPQTTVAFSPCGQVYATGGYDGRVVLWDRDHDAVRWSRRHDRLVNAVKFSPSGALLVSCGADKVGRIWRVEDGALLQVFARQPDDLNSVAWLDEDRLVAVSQDGTGRIWNVADGSMSSVALHHTDHCMAVDAAANGTIATCGEDSTIRIWDPSGRSVRTLTQDGHAESCRWSPDGTALAAGCDDGYVRVFSGDGTLLTEIGGYRTAVKSVAWSPDASHIAIGAYDRTVRIWEVSSGNELAQWRGPHLWPRSLDWAADGKALLVGTVSGAPAVLGVPDLAGADRGARPAVRVESLLPASFTRGVNHVATNGSQIVAGSDDGHVWMWEPPHLLGHLPVGDGALVNAVSVAPNGTRAVAYGTFGGLVGILDRPSADAKEPVRLQGTHPVNRVAWSPDGDRLATADYEGMLRIHAWDGSSLTETATYSGHDGSIKDMCWVDNDQLVTISTDRTAHLVTAEGKRLARFTGHGELVNAGSVSTVAGRAVLATASRDRTIRIYDLLTRDLLTVLVGHDESVKAVAWHPDGQPVLLSGSYDFTARVWTLDPQDWQPASVATLEGHTNAVSCVTWYDGSPLTGSWDGRVLHWRSSQAGNVYTAHELARTEPGATDGGRP